MELCTWPENEHNDATCTYVPSAGGNDTWSAKNSRNALPTHTGFVWRCPACPKKHQRLLQVSSDARPARHQPAATRYVV